jgi:hypothetical protein
MIDFKLLIDLVDKLRIIQAVKGKLFRQPDPAAEKLAVVLQEISKVYLAIESEVVRYLSLDFDASGDLAAERAKLLTLEGGQLDLRVKEAVGHCHKISNIYRKYLDRWFHSVLSSSEASEMHDLFSELSTADTTMMLVLHQLTQWLSGEATEALNLVDAGRLDEANGRVKAARKEILPARQAISKAMSDLIQLQADFIAASGKV